METVGVLFVCLGNICRSPLALAVMRERARRAGIAARLHLDSCGTAAFNAGKPADPRAVAAATRHGYHIDGHVARQIEDRDFARFRYLVAMDRKNLHTLQGWAPAGFAGELGLLMRYAGRHEASEIPDPYYAAADAFDDVARAIERGVDGMIAELCRRHALTAD